MVKCNACGKFLATQESVKCSKCPSVYHRGCVALPAAGRTPAAWICPDCTSKIPRDNSADTPVKGVIMKNTTEEPNETALITTEMTSNCSLSDLISEMRLLREEIIDFRAELGSIRSSISACENRLTVLESRITAIEQKEENSGHTCTNVQNSELVSTVARLQDELNERDQELLLNDLEITNLPECKGENTIHLITLIASKLAVNIDERDIVSAVRVGPHRTSSVEHKSEGKDTQSYARPRAVVVRLTRRAIREEFLRNARIRRGATTSDMGLQESRRFYINERLTRTNRQLFRKAREAGRRQNWRFVWTKDGRIFVRQDQGKPAFRIRSDNDIDRIFGVQIVGTQDN